jgi:hypothetical protein
MQNASKQRHYNPLAIAGPEHTLFLAVQQGAHRVREPFCWLASGAIVELPVL